MDPVVLGCVGIAVIGMTVLGCALIVAPTRSMRALNEWYVVFPDIAHGPWVLRLLCRLAGVGFVGGAIALALSALHLVAQLG